MIFAMGLLVGAAWWSHGQPSGTVVLWLLGGMLALLGLRWASLLQKRHKWILELEQCLGFGMMAVAL